MYRDLSCVAEVRTLFTIFVTTLRKVGSHFSFAD